MRKFLIIAIVIFSASISVVAQNLVANGNLEAWTYVRQGLSGDSLVMPDNWSRGSGAMGTNYTLATDTERGNVLRLNDADGTTVAARRFSSLTNINIPEAGSYRVSFWVKGNVGLRAVILVKGTTAPSTSAQSATNHFTTISNYVSGTANVTSWTKVSADINVPSTATFGDDYRLHLSWSISTGTAPRPVCDFMMDDIVLQKSNNDGLNSISVTPLNYTTTSGTPSFDLAGFSSEILTYKFTSSYLDVPIVAAVAAKSGSTVSISQPVSLTGTLGERTATIVVTTPENKVTTYTVVFERHPGFVSGIAWDTRSSLPIEWGEIAGLYSRNTAAGTNNGLFPAIGNTSIRCNTSSETGYYITTPVLVNGASTLSFYLKNTNIEADNTAVVVMKSNATDTQWHEIGRVQPNTAEWTSWKEVLVNVNDNSAGLKIRFVFEKTVSISGTVYLDDVLVQPFGYTAVSKVILPETVVYVSNNQLFFRNYEPTSYTIYTLNGLKIKQGVAHANDAISLQKGVYIVKIANQTAKIIL